MAEVMTLDFALFNYHINNARKKAKKAFIKRFSQKDWDKEIQPFEDAGIMSIFDKKPNESGLLRLLVSMSTRWLKGG
jgi:hypothetical protein